MNRSKANTYNRGANLYVLYGKSLFFESFLPDDDDDGNVQIVYQHDSEFPPPYIQNKTRHLSGIGLLFLFKVPFSNVFPRNNSQ